MDARSEFLSTGCNWPGRATIDVMGRATVWDVMVETHSVRGARRVASFMECWAITEQRWSQEPAIERFSHEWEMSPTEVDYYVREFRRAFPIEHSPTRIMQDIRASIGHVGIEGLQTCRLDVVRP